MGGRHTESGRLSRTTFEYRFVAHMIGACHADQMIVYGRLIAVYARQVAPHYWQAARDDGRSPEQWAEDDMAYWASDHEG